MKLIHNPYLVAVAILASEFIINFTIGRLFGFNPGDYNVSVVIIFMLAGYLIAMITKHTMSMAYNIKVIVTYFSIIIFLAVLMALGTASQIVGTMLMVMLGMSILFGLISGGVFVLGQHIAVKGLRIQNNKQSAEEK